MMYLIEKKSLLVIYFYFISCFLVLLVPCLLGVSEESRLGQKLRSPPGRNFLPAKNLAIVQTFVLLQTAIDLTNFRLLVSIRPGRLKVQKCLASKCTY